MKFATRLAIIGSILLNVLLASYGYRLRNANNNTTPLSDKFNAVENAIYNDLPIDTNDIVFVGTSLTKSFPLSEFYHDTRYKNRGIPGNVSDHIVQRIPAIINQHPSAIVLEMGVNDILDGVSDNLLLGNYRTVCLWCKEAGVRLFITSMIPYGGKYISYNNRLPFINRCLSQMCDTNGYKFIDVYSSLNYKGSLDRSLSVDGIHVNARGYRIWKGKIDEVIE